MGTKHWSGIGLLGARRQEPLAAPTHWQSCIWLQYFSKRLRVASDPEHPPGTGVSLSAAQCGERPSRHHGS